MQVRVGTAVRAEPAEQVYDVVPLSAVKAELHITVHELGAPMICALVQPLELPVIIPIAARVAVVGAVHVPAKQYRGTM